ncbi:hypothetical protein [Streptomyces sp. MBT27]|uniref:hypothetical protein n=1 Tax=Streptomyces sp. MBT27 TaxID=1488356 RepID=UPI001421CE10|nr:hypothetical protein [Streptomyces sp. MBT27]
MTTNLSLSVHRPPQIRSDVPAETRIGDVLKCLGTYPAGHDAQADEYGEGACSANSDEVIVRLNRRAAEILARHMEAGLASLVAYGEIPEEHWRCPGH